MPQSEKTLLGMMQQRFNLSLDEAQDLLNHAESRESVIVQALYDRMKANMHPYASLCLRDGFASDWLIEGLRKGDKYLAIDAHLGLVWEWTSIRGDDHAAIVEESKQNYQVWLERRRKEAVTTRFETKTDYAFEQQQPEPVTTSLTDRAEFALWDEMFIEKFGEQP